MPIQSNNEVSYKGLKTHKIVYQQGNEMSRIQHFVFLLIVYKVICVVSKVIIKLRAHTGCKSSKDRKLHLIYCSLLLPINDFHQINYLLVKLKMLFIETFMWFFYGLKKKKEYC